MWRNETCGAGQRRDAAVMILEIGLPGNQTGDRSVTVVRSWNRGLLARRGVQRRHPVVARRKAEESTSATSSDGASAALDAFRQRLLGFLERTSNVVDADATSVILLTQIIKRVLDDFEEAGLSESIFFSFHMKNGLAS